MAELVNKYKPAEREKLWQDHWLAEGTYHWDESAPRDETYVIDTPPPTVSGNLHMGHIFSYTQADFIARYQRMAGKTVFYPMGFDDNGLPTERLVEKTKKIRATDLSREDFIAECMGVSEEARKDYRELFSTTALSVDWRQEYHTISEESRTISQMSFLDLFQKDRVYRKLQPMLWDPVDQTAIAQAEIEDKELNSHFNDITFGIENSDETIIIGTTRPEMIPACVAIFYHPEDTRYQHLKGQNALTPLFGVKVPIMEDDTVEPDKGTGIMMCCTFGDEADIEKWRKHDLPARIILNKYGKIDLSLLGNESEDSTSEPAESVAPATTEKRTACAVSEQINNKKAAIARDIIIKLLEESGDLVESKSITHAVKCAERSGAPLEIMPTTQWFVKILDQKEQLKEKAAECNWKPAWMKTRIDQWIDGLSWDWCISRQRYFGVPFPIWYSKRAGEEGKILIASPDQLPINPLTDLPKGYTADEVEPEMDVMDTWATSSISPQLSSKGITNELTLNAARHKQLFPADLRPQGHDIIRTWAFSTIVKAHLHEDTIPWKNLMISGFCLASDKTKMSKSKGNVVTPQKALDDKGSDALRYWASTSKLGTDTAFSEDSLKIGHKLVNKLFNASKFSAMQLANLSELPSATAAEDGENDIITETLDKWILSRLHKAITKAQKAFEEYEYADARVAAEDFFWNDFCDNYLELTKSRAYGNMGDAEQKSACHAIYYCLNAVLKLFAPIVPHVTEEIFSAIYEEEYKVKGSIHARGMWPTAKDYSQSDTAEKAGIEVVALLETVRRAKSEKNVSIKAPLDVMHITTTLEDAAVWDVVKSAEADLKAATTTESIIWEAGNGETFTSEGDIHTITLTYAETENAA